MENVEEISGSVAAEEIAGSVATEEIGGSVTAKEINGSVTAEEINGSVATTEEIDGSIVDFGGNGGTGGGSGTVQSVNGVLPDTDGNVQLDPEDVGAVDEGEELTILENVDMWNNAWWEDNYGNKICGAECSKQVDADHQDCIVWQG
jgi:hypothetical protein